MKNKYTTHLNQLINNHIFLLKTLEYQINILIKNVTKIDNILKLL